MIVKFKKKKSFRIIFELLETLVQKTVSEFFRENQINSGWGKEM